MTGKEVEYIQQAHKNAVLAGDGPFTKKCSTWLDRNTGSRRSFLTHSCTAALEMTALLSNISPGDEVIMPSFTFVTTANAFVLRGGVPVFVDIREDTLNIDESLIEEAINERTRAIVVVHYAGVACEMDAILAIANKYNLKVIEDAAQGMMSRYKGRMLGSMGDLGCYSFHETKNVISGEGGALLVNSGDLEDRAEVIREKGTNRSQFFRGAVDKYTWQDIGSSFLPGELTAAFLWAQLERATEITESRVEVWNKYHEKLETGEKEGILRRPSVPAYCQHNGHMYYVLLPEDAERQMVIDHLGRLGIHVVFHYVPLHSSPGGLHFGKSVGSMAVTNSVSERLVRLPLWKGITADMQDEVCIRLTDAIRRYRD